MKIDIKVPSVGESISEGVITRWFKKNGDLVKANEPLFELETEKATTEVPALESGSLTVLKGDGEKVPIGSVVGRIDKTGSHLASGPAITPVIQSNGPGVVIPPAGPAARSLAEKEGISLSAISGSGKEGRIFKEDVIKHLEGTIVPQPVKETPSIPKEQGRENRQKMTPIRQRIAERLLAAQQNSAILTTFNEADMSAITQIRNKYKEPFQKKHGVGLGFMSFFVKAVIAGLKNYPAVNARIDGSDIVFHNFYDIGVAVSTEKGLMVPVLKGAENMSYAEIEKKIVELAAKARENKISVSDLQGGTFTITNGGVFGSLLSTPILNPPQSGILGMHTIQKRPVVVDDQIVIRPMMYLALSYDHRIVDGREAVSFLVRVKECIENPERQILEV